MLSFAPVSQRLTINVYLPDTLYIGSLSVHVGRLGGGVRKCILRLNIDRAVGPFGAMAR
jgi:hypothetical protein